MRAVARQIPYYNLDMILSVGYRVNSRNAIAFRQWSSKVLKDYIIKGYAIRDNIQLKHYQELKDVARQYASIFSTLTSTNKRYLFSSNLEFIRVL